MPPKTGRKSARHSPGRRYNRRWSEFMIELGMVTQVKQTLMKAIRKFLRKKYMGDRRRWSVLVRMRRRRLPVRLPGKPGRGAWCRPSGAPGHQRIPLARTL